MTENTTLALLRPDPYERFIDEEGNLTEYGIDFFNGILSRIEEITQEMRRISQQS